VKYACIARHVGHYPLRLMCRVLDVSPSGFHAWHKRQPAARAIADALLQVEIAAIHRASRQRYGSPRVHEELRQGRGIRCGRKRVARLMRRNGLRGKRPRRFRVTRQSQHAHSIAPNVLERQVAIAQPNRVWGADITYIPDGRGVAVSGRGAGPGLAARGGLGAGAHPRARPRTDGAPGLRCRIRAARRTSQSNLATPECTDVAMRTA
jgi:hypothetical protein